MTGRSTTSRVAVAACLAAVAAVVMFFAMDQRPTASGQPSDGNGPTATEVPQPPRFAVIGDSYTGGSDEGGYPPNGWPDLVLRDLHAAGIPGVADVSGRGGSGYVKRGTEGTIFGEEVGRFVKPDDRVVVFFGSMNDGEVPRDQLTAGIHGALGTARMIAPQATLLVIGPVWPRPDPPPWVLQIRDVLAAETQANGGMFVDPIAERWLWTRPDVIGVDGIHPTNAGHELMADLIGPHIAQLLNRRS